MPQAQLAFHGREVYTAHVMTFFDLPAAYLDAGGKDRQRGSGGGGERSLVTVTMRDDDKQVTVITLAMSKMSKRMNALIASSIFNYIELI